MKEWYFYQEQGKTMGPLSRDDVRKRIVEGKLRLYDLLYMEGHEQWRMALEFAEFKDDFALSPFATTAGKTWVLLHRKSVDTKDFVTSGPFSQQEVISRLKSGKLAYTDYGWREGFKEWRRLSSLEEFSPQGSPEKRELPPTPVERIMSVPGESLLSKVVEVKKKVIGEAPPPPEASGGDLTKGPPPPPTPHKVKMIEIKREQAPSVAGPTMHITTTTLVEDDDDTMEVSDVKKRRRHRKKFDFTLGEWILIGVMVAAVVGAIYFVGSSFHLFGGSNSVSEPEQTQEEIVSAPEVEEPPPPREPRRPPPPPPPPEAVNVVQSEPDQLPVVPRTTPPGGALRLNVQVANNKVNFTVRSGSKEPVLIQIIGLPGQILGAPSFYRYQRLAPKANGLVPVDSGKFKFTAGRYLIRATRGEVIREEKFSIGVGAPDFQKQLTHARKMFSQDLWRDRLRLMKISEQLEVYLAQKIRQPKKAVKLGDLWQLGEIKFSNGGKYLLFDNWWEFKQIFDEAKKAPSPAQLEKLVEARRRLSQMTIWK